MKLDLEKTILSYRKSQARRKRAADGSNEPPSLFQYDYIARKLLYEDLAELLSEASVAGKLDLALDLGSGSAPYLNALKERCREVHTLDLDPSKSPTFQGAFEAVDLPSDAYDLVLCTQVLEHCENPAAFVQRIAHVLKPGGKAIISAPHIWFYHPDPQDNWRFTGEGLTRICQQNGLQVVQLYAQGGTGAGIAQIFSFCLYGALGGWGRLLYALMNVGGLLADRLVKNTYLSTNFCCLAEKPYSPRADIGRA